MNILPTIVQEVVSQCKKQGFVISSALASFVVRAQLLGAKKDPQNNVELTPEHIERIVNATVRTVTQTDSPSLETLKLQASVSSGQQEQLNQIRTQKVQHKAKTHRMMEEIWVKKDPTDVFNDIVMYVLHESKQLAHTSEAGQKETVQALESVFPKALMDSFIAQKETEKVRQLEEIWRIVWGLRLYNREVGKGGADLADLLHDTHKTVDQSASELLTLIEQMEISSREYAAVLGSPSLVLSDTQRVRLQDEYVHKLQVKIYLTALFSSVRQLSTKVEEFEPTWYSAVTEAKTLCDSAETNPVPKSAIYPRFIALSERYDILYNLHRESEDAVALLESIRAFVQPFKGTLRQSDVDRAMQSLAEDRKPNLDLIASEVKNPAVEYLREMPEDKQNANLEFNGFCIPSFIDEGVLLEGKKEEHNSPGFLLLQVNGAYYSFSSERALKNFSRDPFKYLSQRLMDSVAANPVLIYLLGLHPYLPKELYLAGSRKHEILKDVERGDAVTQTGHIDSYKDTHYVWNEWELRRLALQLAGLRNKRTKSTQSNLSHFRRDNDCQVYPPKVQGTQTLVDAAVQPPRVVQYLKGLRGTSTSEVEAVQKVFLY